MTVNKIKKSDLNRICKNLFNTHCDIEFEEEEIELINKFIDKNDSESFIDFVEEKKDEIKNMEKEKLLDKIDSLLQFVMNCSYEIWKDNYDMNRQVFLSKLSAYEKIAVQFGNFNHQIENGGLSQWDDNGYSEDLDDLYDFLKNSDFKYKDKFISILDAFTDVKNSINRLNRDDDWYDQDVDTRLTSLNHYDKEYYDMNREWLCYFEEYLFNNMPDEYIEKIKEFNVSKIEM